MLALLVAFVSWIALSCAPAEIVHGAAAGPEVEKFTGGHTRVVWVVDSQNKDVFANSADLQLMGYDSRDGLGQRVILPGPESFTVPLLTPDGQRVVFSNQWNNTVSVVDFDGTGRKELTKGILTDLWEDPQSGKLWVYVQKDAREQSSPIVRFPIDDPGHEEIVWNSTPAQVVPVGGFQVSRDGSRAAGLFPWPNAGAADLPDIAWRKQRDGCWPSMAPDNSHMMWIFDGSHKTLIFSRPEEDNEWRINISRAPGIHKHKVYHPRWTNHVRYFAMTGPYSEGGGELSAGGPQVEITLGKFNEDFEAVEAWLPLTQSARAAFFPDVWIEGGENAVSKFHREDHSGQEKPGFDWLAFLRPKPKFSEAWPVSTRGLVFLWDSNRKANEFKSVLGKKRSSRLEATGGARWGPYGDMHLVNGGFLPEESFAKDIREACMKTDQLAVEAVVTTARPIQFGPARIISLSGGIRRRNFTIGQEGESLVLRLQTSESNRNGVDFNLAPLVPGVPHHVVVTYQPGRMVCYIDGKVAAESRLEGGTFEDWKSYDLFFGKEKGGERFWEGYLDHIAIYNRFLNEEEVALKYKAIQKEMEARQVLPTTRVRAELLARAEPPTAESIAPYRRALAVNRYRVVESDDPDLEGGEVQVVEWTLLDGSVPAAYAGLVPGSIRDLELQPYESHPQLESERMLGEGGTLDEPLYYDVSSGR